MAVPLVLQFLSGIGVTGTFNVSHSFLFLQRYMSQDQYRSPHLEKILRTLVIDIHPDNPATASATINIIRGTFAAVGVSIIQVLLDRLKTGWTFTLLAGICATAYPLLSFNLKFGMKWRQERIMKGKKGNESRDTEMMPQARMIKKA